jgi:flagellum-specific peptidoglycan hydrolase FlgJ
MKPILFFTSLLVLLSSASGSFSFSTERPASVQRYIQQYNYLATTLSEQTGIPKPVIFAVAGLESNWGRSELAVLANNHFGIKIKPEWTGKQYCKYTEEYFWFEEYEAQQTMACFRKYSLIKESYDDFGVFVTTRPNYRALQQAPAWNYRAWAEGLHSGGYATDPVYAEKLLRLIWRYRLYEV